VSKLSTLMCNECNNRSQLRRCVPWWRPGGGREQAHRNSHPRRQRQPRRLQQQRRYALRVDIGRRLAL